MNLILLGAPGAGKGTQAELLVQKLNIPSISTGNMLREAMRNGTELGKQVKSLMDAGQLVSDDVILSIVAERVAQPDCKNGFILDGVLEGRMTGRRVCSACGASYHIVANPTKVEGKCDLCGGETAIRKDDQPETVRHRLEVYHASTEILKDYYAKQGKLLLIEGNQPIEDANAAILKALGAQV